MLRTLRGSLSPLAAASASVMCFSMSVTHADVHDSKEYPEIQSAAWNNNWDFRHEQWSRNEELAADKKKKGKVHRIVLIRHGQYESGKCDKERVLSEKGRKQAVATGERLKVMQQAGKLFTVDKVYYSTMARATETSNLILPYLGDLEKSKVQPCSMIREGAPCVPLPAISFERWPVTPEDFRNDSKRIEAAFLSHVKRHSHDDEEEFQGEGSRSSIFICHGNVIRYFVLRAMQQDPQGWLRTCVNNASITIIDVHPNGKVSLTSMGDSGHFPPDLITSN